ncbi:DUF5079 family protein [Staphylococcus lugdunensis]|jgi:hypothetical protein|uniref:DUF5079 family protein n=3 Tax=Staphylococcus lugdunensis TaxID=28035 RepID=A0A4Q9WF92_STALU|nr:MULTISPECIES: DUF5079 family protein [Staphylococcus]AMG61173.1 hypothetical protein AL499_04200 [Staphylococcus lugdunensis]ARJ11988.1 DUF5079 domain-containing protein [Staphylococcus lugdunensis]AST59560.1 DUF5079 domain-containing protein [Staphylococcus lugdunensis]ATG69413.1 DUF5079 domain-containing protein [Staphylococcus lugdunensis]ATN14665.1 DUF5079 domain-containing protein [Staphylococcus lugdunensis]
MSTSEWIEDIRKPAVQIISFFLLGFIGLSFVVFIMDAKIEDMYLGLKISIVAELLIILIGIIMCKDFFNYSYVNDLNKVRRYTKFLTIINVVGTYNVIFVTHNVFYTLALQYEANLEKVWLWSFLLVVSFCIVDAVSNVFILIKLENVEKIISGKTKSMIGIILKLFAQLIFVEKIIEYMSVPASDENRFMILASIIVIFCMNFAAFLFVKKYADFKIEVLED